MAKLTPKQQRFCEEYLIDLNATQAAVRAGYSAKTANKVGPRALVNVGIQVEIQKLMVARSSRTEVTADNVVRELAKIGFSNIGEFMTWDRDGVELTSSAYLTPDQKAAVAEVKVKKNIRHDPNSDSGAKIESVELKLKMHDKRSALVNLGKHLGIFTDRLHLTTEEPQAKVVFYFPENNRRIVPTKPVSEAV
jgi:phage terminase small subunit